MDFLFCTNVWLLMCLHICCIFVCQLGRSSTCFLIPDLVSKNLFTVCQINSIHVMTVFQYFQSASEFEVKKNWKNAYIGLSGLDVQLMI